MNHRPVVSANFWRGFLIAAPIGVAMWAGIIWGFWAVAKMVMAGLV